MADNLDDDTLTELNPLPEKHSEEIISPIETDTTITNQQADTMEVHHHPDLQHKPKKWKEYFLEFIMIFLAVIMGYLAENIRENIVNKEKELKYVENLVRDLKEEKKSTIEMIEENKKMMVAIDTFVSIRTLDFKLKENNQLFFKLFKEAALYRVNAQAPNEITLNQIKATGGLNIIRSKIADLIAELDISNLKIKRSEVTLTAHTEESFRMIYEFVDYPAIWNKDGSLKQNLPPLLMDDKQKLMKYFNLTADLKYTIEGYVYNLNDHLKLVDNLIKTLENDYALKD